MTEWIYIGTEEYEFTYISCEVCESKDGKYCKKIWNDGEEEIYEIA